MIVDVPAPDRVLADSWMPVVNSRDVAAGEPFGVTLMEHPLVLWRTPDGAIRAAHDQCPHRGAALSIGELRGDRIMCPYHGWQFDSDGVCALRPAFPTATPPRTLCLRTYPVREKYGVVWVSLGTPPDDLDYFPPYDEPGTRHAHHDPVVLSACGPRIVENFLDVAHFPFVHRAILGAEPHTAYADYEVVVDDRGVHIPSVWAWQPAATPTSADGADVEYRYHVPHPYIATLYKVPTDGGAGFDLMIMASPVDETHCRVWMIAAYRDDTVSPEAFVAFNQVIFDQDIPIVQSQRPKRLPLDLSHEAHQRTDKISHAYRTWLAELGLTYGVSP